MTMIPDDLERLTEHRLRALPLPRAPHTLLPRVMAAVQMLSRPWYARTWFTWPLAGQLLSAGIVMSIVIGLWWVSPAIQAATDGLTSSVTARALAPFSGVAEQAGQVWLAARVFWHAGLQTLVSILFVLVLIMCAACAAFGAVLDRVALGGALRS
jgi:hypothetical protein